MIGIHDIYHGVKKIGKAEIAKEGLYYHFRCFCKLTGEVIYRLIVSCGEKTENLGILVPAGEVFYLEKRLPVSRFSEGNPVIKAVPGRPQKERLFAPVYPDEPFQYLTKLDMSRMESRNGVVGVSFPGSLGDTFINQEVAVPAEGDVVPSIQLGGVCADNNLLTICESDDSLG